MAPTGTPTPQSATFSQVMLERLLQRLTPFEICRRLDISYRVFQRARRGELDLVDAMVA